MSPITPSVEVTEIKTLLFSEGDICHGPRNLASNEGPSSPRALVVEQDAVTRIHAVGFPVVDGDPESIELGDTVGRTRVKWGGLGLWCLDDFSV